MQLSRGIKPRPAMKPPERVRTADNAREVGRFDAIDIVSHFLHFGGQALRFLQDPTGGLQVVEE